MAKLKKNKILNIMTAVCFLLIIGVVVLNSANTAYGDTTIEKFSLTQNSDGTVTVAFIVKFEEYDTAEAPPATIEYTDISAKTVSATYTGEMKKIDGCLNSSKDIFKFWYSDTLDIDIGENADNAEIVFTVTSKGISASKSLTYTVVYTTSTSAPTDTPSPSPSDSPSPSPSPSPSESPSPSPSPTKKPTPRPTAKPTVANVTPAPATPTPTSTPTPTPSPSPSPTAPPTPAPSDFAAPWPQNSGDISVTQILDTTVNLSWTAGNDDVTAQDDLQYQVYYSSSNNISNVADCEANGTAFGSYTANMTSTTLTGLTPATTYYVNVVLKDEAGKKNDYTMRSFTSGQAPVPGDSGDLIKNSGVYTATVNWTAATDDFDPQTQLGYLVYYSTSNNISTVAQCEANGTAVGSYALNITAKDITGLSPNTTYYTNVVVRDDDGLKASYTSSAFITNPAIPPTAGNSGTITTSGIGLTDTTLNWTAATDDTTAQNNLNYQVYISTSNNISDVAACEANGTTVGSLTQNITTKDLTGLSQGTTYYANVVVVDNDGLKSAYTSVSLMTLEDTTGPTAGNSGTITETGSTTTTISVSWTAATDDFTAQANLEYIVYYSSSDNISSASDCEANGTAVGGYTANMTSKEITGLEVGQNYYINVVVRDETGNKTAYSRLFTNTQASMGS